MNDEQLAMEWARFKGYPLPDEPSGCLWPIAIVSGFLLGFLPGLLAIYLWDKKKKQFRAERNLLIIKWIDAGRPSAILEGS
jgi:hypothetical protein